MYYKTVVKLTFNPLRKAIEPITIGITNNKNIYLLPAKEKFTLIDPNERKHAIYI